MTAEIAILNRNAVALAADSIVTLTGQDRPKTYDSAEKIFQLSRFQPIGLMIYNNAHYMGAPLEIVVRRFRETLTSRQFTHLTQVWPVFHEFLLEFPHALEDEHEHFRAMAGVEIIRLQAMLYDLLVQRLGRRLRKGEETPDAFLLRRIRERQAQAEAQPLAGFEDVTLEAFVETYGPCLDAALAEHLRIFVPDDDQRQALRMMMFAVVCSTLRTDAATGFVFAGFGTEEFFPTLYSIEVDGLYFGRFRAFEPKIVDIDRRGETAAVVPFAQIDMAERFIQGIDSKFETRIEKLALTLVGEVIDQKRRAFPRGRAEEIKAIAAQQFREGLDRLKRMNENTLNSVVNHLSKTELGEFAYHLVELTSRKARYSNDIETVGGPIDVAILTRNEGFIWVRRKHYFDVSLNPRYNPNA